jgi:hypothetical protein
VTAGHKIGEQQGLFKRNKGKRGKRKNRKKINICFFKTSVWAQPLVGRRVEPGHATASST